MICIASDIVFTIRRDFADGCTSEVLLDFAICTAMNCSENTLLAILSNSVADLARKRGLGCIIRYATPAFERGASNLLKVYAWVGLEYRKILR